MRLFTGLLLLVLFIVAEARRGKRLGQDKLRGRSKSNSVKRFAGSCKEYIENGDKFLDCQDCHLTAVLLDWPEDIDHLLLAQNRLKVLQDNTFSHFRNLVSLDLQLNEISLIMEGAFSGLSKLTTLLLQHNRLQVVSEAMFIPMPRLRYLRLHDNPWTCNCQLDSLVHFLQVPSNRYMGNFAKCAEPTRFWGQQLKTLDPKLLCMPPMQSQVHLPRLHSDTALLCHIRDFPKPLLDCRSRGLNAVPPDIPENTVKMDLAFNNITQLRPKEFVTIKDLKLLNLSCNSLERIDTAAFSGLLHLRELDLSNNSLHYFNYGVLEDLYYLRTLSLGGNPWICDYNIHYLIYWLKHHPAVEHTGLVCSEPAEFHGWPVESYVKTYNAECPKDKQVDLHGGTGPTVTTSQELNAETVENPDLLPSPLRKKGPNKFEIYRLS
ncbi:leucine-rich repeat-containing protein 17 [Ictalurus punctatus]|uniref:Leucine-rich repeat-containing protein 17 n=1 Tax=Ictalurus punctatus TaxID=7998 RepID=A0A2D0SCW6_ICTPU|nr:leucine-rich repeat-containing protein 17 [Ictalurus punctatus]XP_017340090.1 leucine-rich repeat-containing protein 17 [Ictalurus punctatus]